MSEEITVVEEKEVTSKGEESNVNFLDAAALKELASIEESIIRATGVKNYYGVAVNTKKPTIECLSTGVMTLDYILGKGVPKGLIMQFYGQNSVGKSVLMATLLSAFQKEGKLVALVDAEHRFDPDFASMCGLDIDKLALVKPNNLEEALEAIRTLIKCGKFAAVGLDSVASLAPKEELEKTMDEQVIGKISKAYCRLFREIAATAEANQCSVILLNQIRSNISTYGSGMTTTGGNSIPYHCSIIGEVKRDKKLDKDDSITSVIKIIKNSVATPFKEGEITIKFPYVNENGEVKAGIDPVSDLVNIAIRLNVITRSGAWYYYRKGESDELKANGKDKLVAMLEADLDKRQIVTVAVQEAIKLNA